MMTTQDLINAIYSFVIKKSDLLKDEEVTDCLAQAKFSSYWKQHNDLLELFNKTLNFLYKQDEPLDLEIVTIMDDATSIELWRKNNNKTTL
jgi:hypothetical protein